MATIKFDNIRITPTRTKADPIISTNISNMIVKPSTREDCKLLCKLGCKDLEGNNYRVVMPEKFKCKHVCKTTPGGGFLGMGDSYFNTWSMYQNNKKKTPIVTISIFSDGDDAVCSDKIIWH